MHDPEPHPMTPIATIRSCYPQRFGIPRQAGIVESATATVNFIASRDNELALRDIETFSHLWIVFIFHKQNYGGFKPLVQPPRLGGKKTMGVYATRSPNRTNRIGLSAVQLDRVEHAADEIKVHVLGGDFLDGTPVLDIKPYVPFADSIPQATATWAAATEPSLQVEWSPEAHDQLTNAIRVADADQRPLAGAAGLKTLIEETIAQDPRPAHERNKDGKDGQTWGIRVGHVDLKWKVNAGVAVVVSLVVV